ncbi:MAG: hypothetical protein WAT66_01810 [Actinomycetota bacterium]
MSARRRIKVVTTGTITLLAVSVAAWAFFTALGIGFGSASAGTLAAPTNVTVPSTVSGTTVPVSWTAPTPPGSGTVSYYVQRYVGATPSAACGTSPSSLITTTSCNDTGVGSGTYTYKVTALWRTWTKQSAASGSVTVQSDATPPTASISFPVNGASYPASAYNAGCTPAGICGSAADATGVQSVKVSVKRNSDNKYWNGSAFSVVSETFNTAALSAAGATATNWNYALALPADGAYTLHVQTTDTLGNAQSGTTYAALSSFNIDTTAPTASITFPVSAGSYKNSTWGAGCTPVGICGTATDVTGVQSVRISIKRNSDNNYWNGTAFSGTSETFNATTLASAGGTSTTWTYGFAMPADDGYTIHVQATDTLGNAQTGTTYAATATFTIDTANPTVTLTFPVNGQSYAIGNNGSSSWNTKSAAACAAQAMCGTAADASGSGIQKVELSILGANGKYWDGTFTSGKANFTSTTQVWNSITGTSSWSQAWGNATFSTTGSYTVSARSTDNAGNVSSAVSATFTTT